uniref:Uncharacterized protein n=1 Tax=Anguilla anguilla TaxID=7936 RepID=A0A0E9V909_ANGAN
MATLFTDLCNYHNQNQLLCNNNRPISDPEITGLYSALILGAFAPRKPMCAN